MGHPEVIFIVQALILIGGPYFLHTIPIIKRTVPLVVVQIFAGIVLGPSVLGQISHGTYEALFPRASLGALNGLSWTALILFGFMTGTHLNMDSIKGKGGSFGLTAATSLLVPFAFCLVGGWWLMGHYPQFVGARATSKTFALAIGIAGGVTALPVLTATLIDLNMINKKTGGWALGLATVNDALLWILVSALLTLTSGGSGHNSVSAVIFFTVLFLAVMFGLIRPFLTKLVTNKVLSADPHNGQLVGVCCFIFASAIATELIGVHFLLGAFCAGMAMPKEVAHGLEKKFDSIVSVVLLPFFFAKTGLATAFDWRSHDVWAIFAIVTVLSSIGKLLGTIIPARFVAKLPWFRSLKLGSLMQCKGLMEVVVLSMMLQANIITPVAFSGLMLMAVFTTTVTKPMVQLCRRYKARLPEPAPEDGGFVPELTPEQMVS